MMRFFGQDIPDGYEWHLRQGPLKNITENYYR